MKKYIMIPLVALLLIGACSTSTVFARWDKPCNHKKIVKWFWCEACQTVSEFPDCKGAEYIWNFKEYEAGEGKYADSKKHQDLPEGWACEKIQYLCNNPECKMYEKCVPQVGVCDVCMEDFQSNGVLARILYKCTGCGKEHTEPGNGAKLREGAYVPTLEKVGMCPDDGKPLEIVCTLSGTCPHIAR